MASRGMCQSSQAAATRPRSASIRRSLGSPRFTCTETQSAPCLMPSSTVPTRVLVLPWGESMVEADRWTMRPTSLPALRCEQRTRPLCMSTASAPPTAMSLTVSRMSMRPSTAPMVTPWSMGTMIVRPVSRLMMRSRRTCLPRYMGSLLVEWSRSGGAGYKKRAAGYMPAAPKLSDRRCQQSS